MCYDQRHRNQELAPMEEALRTIIAKSPATAAAALKALRAVQTGRPTAQQQYNAAAEAALADAAAPFTTEDRAQIAAHILESDGARTFMLRVRLTEAERADLARQAQAAGLDMSEYVRSRLFD
jgi:hypothetical protein